MHPALTFFQDVEVVHDPLERGSMDFRLSFRFAPNEYFSDSVLTKDYEVRLPEPNGSFAFEGPEVVNCRGCKVHWNKGKNVTLRPVKKVQKVGQMVCCTYSTAVLQVQCVAQKKRGRKKRSDLCRTARLSRSGRSATASSTSSLPLASPGRPASTSGCLYCSTHTST